MTATTEQNHEEADLVVVGSSAGGIEALSILVSTLPTDFPAPIVLAQHLDPTHPSNLSSILQRKTSLKVESINSSSLMKPGSIYVVPADRHVIITDGHVTLQEDPSKRPRPSIDWLLTTAAEVYGERLIAVILTGSGSDGAAGGIAVKQAGGTVVIQNPQTARYPSMPLALPPTVVDIESDIERIGPLLYDLLNRTKAPEIEEKTGDTLQKIFDQIKGQTTFNFRPYKIPTIVRRITRRMLVVQANTMQDYAQYLETHPEEITNLVSAFLINVTHFFRDLNAFAYLKSDVLPKLIAQARAQDRRLRFWSAGCSTGEEAYSLAMLLADLLGAELPQWDIKIFATDLDAEAVQFARRGVYSETLLKDVPVAYRQQFLEPVEHGYRISKTLRQLITFGQHDLSQNGPFPRINLILCRNVLIYFSPRLQNEVLDHFSFSLNSDGYLFLGKAESIRATIPQYELVNKTYKVYHCSKTVLPLARRLNQSTVKRVSHGKYVIKRAEESAAEPATANVMPEPVELARLGHFDEVLLRLLPIGVIVIDRFYRLLTTNAAVRRLLGILERGIEQDFLHAVPGIPYDQVRTAIDTAFRDHTTITLSDIELSPKMGGTGRFISLTITIMPTDDAMAEIGVISVSDVTEQVQVKQKLQSMQIEQAHLVNELSAANEALNRRNDELLDANDKLHVSNEDLLLTHEELQASLEEFETTNEELQASNEELETANEESLAANEELQTMNQEATARQLELMELVDSVASEQVVLKEMVELAPFYIMVLRGPTLAVQAFNPRYVQLLHDEQVQGQPLAQVANLFWVTGATVTDLAHQAYQLDVTLTSPRMLIRMTPGRGDSVERYLICTIVPSHDSSGKVYGVVIYTNDVTEQRTQEIEQELERLHLIFDRTRLVAFGLFDAQTTQLIVANARYLEKAARIGELSDRELIGQTWHESTLFVPDDQALELWNSVITNREPVPLLEVRYKFAQDPQETVWDGMLIPIIYPELPEEVRFVLIYAMDITEQVAARQKLEEANQLKLKFLAMISHELRTPLTSIKGFATTLLATDVAWDAESQRGFVTVINEEVDKLTDLIGQLLDLSRLQAGALRIRPEPHNLNEIVGIAMAELESVAQQRLVINLDHDLPPVMVDAQRIAQVLVNLVDNAAKYSPPSGRITLSAVAREDNLQVNVVDEGPGIPVENRESVFEAFLQLENSLTQQGTGLGLGLAICKGLIEAHGGKIWVADTTSGTMSFTLPIATPTLLLRSAEAE
jgi:two-component system, chemotaxis family, CheB/CheR fusion protein